MDLRTGRGRRQIAMTTQLSQTLTVRRENVLADSGTANANGIR